METKLAADLLDVAFGRSLGNEKPGCYLAVRQPLGDEGRNLSLPAREIRCPHPGLAGRIATVRRLAQSAQKIGTENRYLSQYFC
jgi:hypothetical protein